MEWKGEAMTDLDRDDVVSILDYFRDLEDSRSTVNRKHLLGDLIVISICGVLSGADGPKAIGIWAKSNSTWLQGHLELPNGVPSHDTIGRLLATLKESAFQSCFQKWIASLRDEAENHDTQELVAIDGKGALNNKLPNLVLIEKSISDHVVRHGGCKRDRMDSTQVFGDSRGLGRASAETLGCCGS